MSSQTVLDKTNLDKSALAMLSLAALGVVYGDIGTSPLYALKEVFAGPHHPVPITPDNVLGILSLILWSLIIVVTVKYIFFVMRADNKGEGGILALLVLALRNSEEGSPRHSLLITLGLFGTALFYGDGVVTPAISVLSAVEGLEVATPAFQPYIIPITLIVLVGLFLMQSRGTAMVGSLFGPVMCLWFGTLAALGIINIIAEPGVIRAFNPIYAISFILANPVLAFFSLGGVVLALTGAEALYADMGHFGRKPIQIIWYVLVLPALVLNYFGQGALLLNNPKAIDNPFFKLAPEWMLYPLVALATAATVIASQAVISGVYSMTQQAIQLGYSPRMEVKHTSDETIGQIYLPSINWTLLIAVILLVLGFGSSAKLAAAYGIAVTGTMLVTSILAFAVMRWLWRWPLWLSILVILPFTVIDLAFFSANLVKIFDGGWFPLLFGLGVYSLLTTWKNGRKLHFSRLAVDTIDLKAFIQSLKYDGPVRVPGTAVFMTPDPNGVPPSLLHSLKHFKTMHERVVLVTVVSLDVPHVPDAQRLMVERLPLKFWRIKVFYGYMDEPDLPAALEWCAEQGIEFDIMETSFFLGHDTLIPRIGCHEMSYWREVLFITMSRNAGKVTTYYKLPVNRVVELGSQVVL